MPDRYGETHRLRHPTPTPFTMMTPLTDMRGLCEIEIEIEIGTMTVHAGARHHGMDQPHDGRCRCR
jgi:hypothetical protein